MTRETLRIRGRRLLVAGLCVFGFTVGPVFAASIPVSSTNLTSARTCVLNGVSAASTSSIDSDVKQTAPGTNTGTASSMNVASQSGSRNIRIYVKFDLTKCAPAIASSVTIRTATVRLFITTVPNACRTHDIFDVPSSPTWTETGVTWTNQPFGTTSNNPASAQATAQMVVGSGCAANTTNNQYVTGWNVTADVATWVAGSATNAGWMIRDDVEDSSTARTGTYAARDAGNAARAPQLIIDYTT